MNTSLSTGCVASSSSLEMLGKSPSCEDFHGTSASDFGESSLPSTDTPDTCTSPSGFAAVGSVAASGRLLGCAGVGGAATAAVLTGFFAPTTAAVRGAAAWSATAMPLATSNDTETMSA